MLGNRTDLHIFDAGSANGNRSCNEILLPYVRLFRNAMGLQFLFMDDNAPCHRTVAAEQLSESEDIARMHWPARSPDLNPIEHVWYFLGRRFAARTLTPVTFRELRLALQDEFAAMPQQLIDTLILSMGRRCETCLAGAKFEQILEFERDKIVGLCEAGLSYRAVAACVQRNSSTIMRVSKQWTDEGRTARKSESETRNVTSTPDDRRLRRLLQRLLRARIPLHRIPLTQNHRHLRLQWSDVHRSWRADWQQVVFSDESRFNLWHHDGRIRVMRYAGEMHIPECIIERHSRRTPGVIVWGATAYHGRSQLLRIVGNLNSTRYINEVLQPQAIPFPARISRCCIPAG
ncbi:transposable element Tc1 transposase [Trichonephila clavipes]|nr:transposable element Tc1 transposase [Trichonephila clavipes]